MVGSDEIRRVLLKDEYVQSELALHDSLTLAVVGIGETQPSRTLELSRNSFGPRERDELAGLGAVGDICLRFFDEHGRPVSRLDDRVIGASLEQLAAAPRTVGVAGGRRKHAAIHGALLGRLVNVLVTDCLTAQWLAEDKRSSRAASSLQSRPTRTWSS